MSMNKLRQERLLEKNSTKNYSMQLDNLKE